MDPKFKSFKLLLIEDNSRDAELILTELRHSGFSPEYRTIKSEDELRDSISWKPDIIISDFSLPQYDGLRAVKLLRSLGLDIPFILISGNLSEESAIESIKHGVDDYLLKDSLLRLGTSVENALIKKHVRDEKKIADQQFRLSAKRQSAIINSLPARVALIDQNGEIIEVNQAWEQFINDKGFDSANVGQDYLAHCRKEFDQNLNCPVEHQIRSVLKRELTAFSCEYPTHWKEKRLWFSLMVNPLSKTRLLGAVVMHIDITDRKLAEENLKAKEAEQRRLVTALSLETKRLHESQKVANIGSWTTNFNTMVSEWTLEAFNIFEISPSDNPPSYQRFLEMVHPEDRRKVEAEFKKSIENPHGQFSVEHRILFPDSRIKHVEQRWKCEVDESNATLLAVGTCQDITKRKLAEESNLRLATAVEQAAESIVITDTKGKIQYVNPAFEKTSGYMAQEAIGCNPRILKSGVHDRAFYEKMWSTLKRGEVWQGHLINRKKDGSLYEEETTLSSVHDETGKITNFVAVKRDVTREVQLESQFRQSQKMEAIGQLAGGIAHDFNNILAVIIMQTEINSMNKEMPDRVRQGLREIKSAAQKAANLTRQLLLFSRKQVMQPERFDLNKAVANLARMLARIIQENIRIDLKLSPNPLLIYADPNMVDQILMNLSVNARDAMPNGGTLTIETSLKVVTDSHQIENEDVLPGNYVCLAVSDTGIGMDASIVSHIFEPFFTTKSAGSGTGLGLATVFGIVKQHKGWIDVSSEVGKGTSFKIYLKTDFSEEKIAVSDIETDAKPHGNNQLILLVEDEVQVRAVSKVVLENFNYRVLEAENATAAINIWRTEKDRISLLLTDIVMPGDLDGRELAQIFRQEKAGLKVIYTSGYSSDIAGKEFVLKAGEDFIQKPFTSGKLLRTIHACLEGKTE